MAEIPGLSRPIVYVVAFSSDDDVDADYSPIVTGTEISADGSTFPQLLSREIVPALPEQGWNRDQIAQFVGLVVMRAAEAEHCLSLVASYSREPGTFDRDVFWADGQTAGKST